MIFKTKIFDKLKNDLIKEKNHQYVNCEIDIIEEFKNKTFENLVEIRSTIAFFNNLILKKIRINNSKMKTGKSGGYRLFYIADTYNSKIILVYIYPKTGSKGKTDIEHDLYQTMIDDYTDSLVNNELIPFNV